MADKESGYPGQQPADAHGSESNTMAFGAEQALGRLATFKVVEVTESTNKDGEVKRRWSKDQSNTCSRKRGDRRAVFDELVSML